MIPGTLIDEDLTATEDAGPIDSIVCPDIETARSATTPVGPSTVPIIVQSAANVLSMGSNMPIENAIASAKYRVFFMDRVGLLSLAVA
jgi:hypothetical protein